MLKGGNASRQHSFGIYNPMWTIFPKFTAFQMDWTIRSITSLLLQGKETYMKDNRLKKINVD